MGEVGDTMRPDTEDPDSDDTQGHPASPPAAGGLGHDERAVFDAVESGIDDADLISTSTTLDMARVTSILTSLQLKGLVTRLAGNRFVLRRS